MSDYDKIRKKQKEAEEQAKIRKEIEDKTRLSFCPKRCGNPRHTGPCKPRP